MKKKDNNVRYPWIPIYSEAFVASTAYMSNEMVGCYMRLLMHQAINGGIPNCKEAVSEICHGNAYAYAKLVPSKFQIDDSDGLLRNKRMASEAKKRSEYNASRKRNAIDGWKKRWTSITSKQNKANSSNGACASDGAMHMQEHMQSECIKRALTDTDTITEHPPNARAKGFTRPTLEQVIAYATSHQCSGSAEAATKFFNEMEFNCWITKSGQPITSASQWQGGLRSWCQTWRNNENRDKLRDKKTRGGKEVVEKSTFEGGRF